LIQEPRDYRVQLAVVGSGLAGFAASIFALDRGLATAQVGNTGAIAYTTGYLDLLGVEAGRVLNSPWDGLERLRRQAPDHPLSRINDDDIRTAWCEGVKGSGAGQSITIEWHNAGPLRSLWLSNGYAKSSKSFRNNSRVKDITVAMWRAGSGDGDYTVFQHRLQDHGVEQVIDLPFPQVPLRKMLIRIDSTYAGAKWQDTCINELWTDFGM